MVNYGSLDAEFTGGAVASDGFTLEQFPYAPDHTLYVSLEKDYGNYRMRLDHSRILFFKIIYISDITNK